MAITAYQGLPGSGKSYQVVSHVIVKAIREGRRVVTNIDGIKFGVIAAYLMDSGVKQEKLGSLHYVEDSDVIRSDDFWYDPEHPDSPSVVGAGDLVVIDEAWEFFEDAVPLSDRAMLFFRKHRHFVHPVSGVACDVVLVTQDVMDIGRKVRRVIEQTFSMSKLKELGSDKTFRIDIYQKTNTKKKPVFSELGRYNPEFFNFYSSYDNKGGGDSKEKRADSRGTVWKSPFFKYMLPLAVIMVIWGAYAAFGIFSNKERLMNIGSPASSEVSRPPPVPPQQLPQFNPGQPVNPVSTSQQPVQAKASNNQNNQPNNAPNNAPKKSELRLIGFYGSADKPFLVFFENDNYINVPYADVSEAKLGMVRHSAVFDGRLVSAYTGQFETEKKLSYLPTAKDF